MGFFYNSRPVKDLNSEYSWAYFWLLGELINEIEIVVDPALLSRAWKFPIFEGVHLGWTHALKCPPKAATNNLGSISAARIIETSAAG